MGLFGKKEKSVAEVQALDLAQSFGIKKLGRFEKTHFIELLDNLHENEEVLEFGSGLIDDTAPVKAFLTDERLLLTHRSGNGYVQVTFIPFRSILRLSKDKMTLIIYLKGDSAQPITLKSFTSPKEFFDRLEDLIEY